MRNWRIMGLLAVLILGLLLTSGCTNTGSTGKVPAATPAPQGVSVTVTPTPVTGQKTVLFSDDLSSWRSEWDPVHDSTDGKTFYSGGSLHIRDNKPPSGTMYHTLNKKLNDFVLDVDTKLVDGTNNNWQGVDIRVQDEDNDYGFAVSGDGYYTITMTENGDIKSLIGKPTFSSYVNTGVGSTNHLRVEAHKNTLSFSVNGHDLTSVTDNTFAEGTVGLLVNCVESNTFTEVSFNNLVITQV